MEPSSDPGTAWMFHYLHQDMAPAPYTVTPTALGDFVQGQLDAGRRAVPLQTWHDGPVPGTFVLTFDDAHRSVADLARPVLAELGVPATLFVPTGWVGQASWCLSWRELEALRRERGWTLGSHGRDHHRMSWRRYGESPAAHAARLAEEVAIARRALVDNTGSDGALFAYPFGEAPPAAVAAVRAAGHRLAVTVDPGPWGGELLRIPRADAVPPLAEAPLDGISVIVPACDRRDVLAEVVRRLRAQSYPSERHEILVIDDGSSPPLAELGVEVLRLPESDQRFRAGQARQLGADRARFEGLCFLDADVAVGEDFLWAVDWVLGRDVEAVCLGYLSGYNLHDIGHVHRLADIAAASKLTGEHTPVIPDRSREATLRPTLDNPHWGDAPWSLCYTGNLALRRGLLARAGGFARDFTGWGFEDVDLGARLARAGGRFTPSRWALGYHLVGPQEEAGSLTPSNPFRRVEPTPADFAGVLRNLDTLARRHPADGDVQDFVRSVRADVAETTSRPDTVGVECGGPLPGNWSLPGALHRSWPGGRDSEAVRDRLAYARKVGARHLYLLGGDVLAREELAEWLVEVRTWCGGRIVAETTGERLAADPGLAVTLAQAGLSGLVLELWCDRPRGHWAAAVDNARAAGLTVAAKPILGDEALARTFCASRALKVWDVWADRAVDWPGATVRQPTSG